MNRDRKQLMAYSSRGGIMNDVTVFGKAIRAGLEELTMRDLFAMTATEEDIADVKNLWESDGGYISREFARYVYADAMLEARDETN